MTWAGALKRVFNIKTCKTSGGHIKIIAFIEDPQVIEKVLIDLERKYTSTIAPRLPPSQGLPQVSLLD